MIIDLLSDLHGYLPVLQGGDLLIIAGDITASDRLDQWNKFFIWLKAQQYEKKVLIAGNHDGFLEQCISTQAASDMGLNENEGFTYLCDSGTEYQGLKIWGSPWTPAFFNWHFMKYTNDELRQVWDKIPMDTDILITHGPAYGVLDECRGGHAGCNELRKAIDRVKPGLHVFGHIHEQGGKHLLHKHLGPNTLCVNASIMDENYRPINKPTRVKYGINPLGNCLWDIGFNVNESKADLLMKEVFKRLESMESPKAGNEPD